MNRLVQTDQAGVVRAIARGIDRALQNDMHVLWLLSGGSNIALEVEVQKQLQHASKDKLTISMIDERYVPLISPHSNWHLLQRAGLSDEQARFVPPIVNLDQSLEDIAADFAKRLDEAVLEADVIIGQFGIGPDGHTAGILPHSPAVNETSRLVVGYTGPDFERLTTTPALFAKLDLAIAVAFGEAKAPILERMPSDISAAEQPAQLLLQAKELIVYTDQNITWPSKEHNS